MSKLRTELIQRCEDNDVVGFIDTALDITASDLPAINIPASRLVLMLIRISDALLYDLEATVQRPEGISSSGFHLCWILWLIGPAEASTAASLMGVSRATISGISNTLERSGHLARTRHPNDGRSVILNLTPSGRAEFEAIFVKTNDRYCTWVSALTGDEVSTLVGLLAKLAEGGQDAKRRK
ncbi:MarR family transcriptional regulator [Pseudomonas sp. LB-090624]|uniref:MarR family winged helix-turn-helix transcriptional regulator n=1 Tax=Pseudomonas sp. LB-090624 TaxID=2213079 RepID=UPI000D97B2D1|nr:MarR family transcriptional regulator [Pseudomonas sp. LB-090624]PYB78867.1 MarR family transcriptional regulator [Pseudomonas sp. LB-090624]